MSKKENIKCQNNPNLTENLAKDRNKLSNSNSSVSSAKTSPQTNQQIEEGNFKTKEELSKEQALIGDREIELRNKFGPKRITKESLIEQKKIA